MLRKTSGAGGMCRLVLAFTDRCATGVKILRAGPHGFHGCYYMYVCMYTRVHDVIFKSCLVFCDFTLRHRND